MFMLDKYMYSELHNLENFRLFCIFLKFHIFAR